MSDPKPNIAQRLVMTPQLQQAIRFLQLSLAEINTELPRLRKHDPGLDLFPRAPQPIGPYAVDSDVVPEVYVWAEGEGHRVVANTNAFPAFIVCGVPLELTFDPDVKSTIPDQIAAAGLDAKARELSIGPQGTARAIEQRMKTHVQFVRWIAKTHPTRLTREDSASSPGPTIRDVAEGLGMHESTIRHIIAAGEKVIRCPRGFVRFDAVVGKAR